MLFDVELNPSGFSDWNGLTALLQGAFQEMEGVIAPPSSLNRMSALDFQTKSVNEDLFLIRAAEAPIGCLFGARHDAAYVLSKLAVVPSAQGLGLGRRLVVAAAARAEALGCDRLELQSRVELTGNHAAFRKMGFIQTGTYTHPGYQRPTSLTFQRRLACA